MYTACVKGVNERKKKREEGERERKAETETERKKCIEIGELPNIFIRTNVQTYITQTMQNSERYLQPVLIVIT